MAPFPRAPLTFHESVDLAIHLSVERDHLVGGEGIPSESRSHSVAAEKEGGLACRSVQCPLTIQYMHKVNLADFLDDLVALEPAELINLYLEAKTGQLDARDGLPGRLVEEAELSLRDLVEAAMHL